MQFDSLVDATGELDVPDDATAAYLTFDLAAQTFAVDVRCVREILDPEPVTRLPNAARDMLGVINVRGTSVPIVDLSARLGIDPSKQGPDSRMIIFDMDRTGADPRPIGVLAEQVRDVWRLTLEDIEQVPDIVGDGVRHALVRGLCRRDGALIVMVDLTQIFADQSAPGP